jgi:hypothetical protein
MNTSTKDERPQRLGAVALRGFVPSAFPVLAEVSDVKRSAFNWPSWPLEPRREPPCFVSG